MLVPHRRRPPAVTVSSCAPLLAADAEWLRGYIDWCTTQPWADDLAEDLRELHAQARQLAGYTPPRPVAPCPDCGGPLWPLGDTDTGRGLLRRLPGHTLWLRPTASRSCTCVAEDGIALMVSFQKHQAKRV
ncbi:hypothetical protein [Saccharopolyspora sp. ASAGF58]|uniref:hypothetical protein n=1 Tax=Saccharopolyspora sp. ASAGF58 TaxID=2719023 RepID=UPI00143FBD63|nr:hypothetical protein [Saccharopolyspora sp. ASAGF58]QIZ35817.1 hypothetical protein FDZ84_15315 [Saccharopolyspora sp. ASAGF58]